MFHHHTIASPHIFEPCADVHAFYTSKKTGNFSDYVGDDEMLVEHRREELATFIGHPIYLAKQVHGDTICCIDTPSDSARTTLCVGEADGLMTNCPHMYLAIQTADCAAVLLYESKKHVIAALHAGRAGAKANITGTAIEKMITRYNGRPEDIYLFVSPYIKGCHYELPNDMLDDFRHFPEAIKKIDNAKSTLDIGIVIAKQAMQLGVCTTHIEVSATCTACEHEHFFSYRASHGQCGRQLTIIGM